MTRCEERGRKTGMKKEGRPLLPVDRAFMPMENLRSFFESESEAKAKSGAKNLLFSMVFECAFRFKSLLLREVEASNMLKYQHIRGF